MENKSFTMRGISLAYLIRQHIQAAHISPGQFAYLKLDEEMIARSPIVNSKSNLKQTQVSLDWA